METLRYERLGHVGWLHLNRPQKLNAMTAKMWEEMRILGQELGNDPEVRALVVIGEGRSFSAGIDTSTRGVTTRSRRAGSLPTLGRLQRGDPRLPGAPRAAVPGTMRTIVECRM